MLKTGFTEVKAQNKLSWRPIFTKHGKDNGNLSFKNVDLNQNKASKSTKLDYKA